MSSVLKVHKALLILYTVGLWSKLSPSKFGSHEKLQRQVKQKIKYASLAYFIYSFHSSNLIVQLVSGHQWTNEQHPLLNSITMIFCNMIKINSGQWQVELLLDLREPIKASDEFSFGKSACFDWGVFVENTLWPCFGVNWLFGYQLWVKFILFGKESFHSPVSSGPCWLRYKSSDLEALENRG